jgi:hypothetical protein
MFEGNIEMFEENKRETIDRDGDIEARDIDIEISWCATVRYTKEFLVYDSRYMPPFMTTQASTKQSNIGRTK